MYGAPAQNRTDRSNLQKYVVGIDIFPYVGIYGTCVDVVPQPTLDANCHESWHFGWQFVSNFSLQYLIKEIYFHFQSIQDSPLI